MPKIKITETDVTSSGLSVAADNVVYIPGPALAGQVATTPLLYTTTSELDEGASTYGYNTAALSFKLARYLISTYGFYVLYESLTSTETTVPDTCWTALQDKGSYSVRFLTTGQYGCAETGVSQQMVNCAAVRGDCIALCDHPRTFNAVYVLETSETAPLTWPVGYYTRTENPAGSGIYEYNPVPTEETPAYAANTYYKNIATPQTMAIAVRTFFETVASSGEYAAGFTPWFETNLSDLGATTSSVAYIPASFGYLFAYGRSIQNYPEWYAIAGASRGLINELSVPTIRYSESDCEILQARSASGAVTLDASGDNADFAVNPIAQIRPYGYILWGNRTLLIPTVSGDGTGELKATSFLNIRNMVCTIKKVIFQAARRFTFDQNNEILWVNFSSAITPTLENMKSGNGLLGYKFKRVATDKKARLKANLVIVPIEAVEDFEINIELTDSIEAVES